MQQLRPLPLPVAEPDRLVWICNSYPRAGVVEASNGVLDYYDRKQAVPAPSHEARGRT